MSARAGMFGSKRGSCVAAWSASDRFSMLGCAMEGMKDGLSHRQIQYL